MTRLKKLVYLNRIRLKDFFVDFDRLRKGTMLPANFLRGLALAGVDKVLTAAELQAVATHYTVGTSLHYTRFLADVDIIFTKPNLERRPLEEVPVEPAELLDRDRYKRSNRDLGAHAGRHIHPPRALPLNMTRVYDRLGASTCNT